MHVKRRTRWIAGAGAIVALVLGVTLGANVATAGGETRLDHFTLCDPDPAVHTFASVSNNLYFPFAPGDSWVLTGKEQGEPLGLQITVLGTQDLYRGSRTVTTRVIEESEWVDTSEDGVLDPDEQRIETSLNYVAQTEEGTVCYFGEDVDIYESGVVVSHDGSWRADRGDNAPGILMPAQPEVGMTFQQEVAPGVAMDEATIVGIRSVTVPAGRFENAIRVRDFNPLDGSRGIKWYAPGVGLVVDGPLELQP